MFITNFPRFVFAGLFVFTTMISNSQNTKEVVILYNSQPVKAIVTSEGTIVEKLPGTPDFPQEYAIQAQDFTGSDNVGSYVEEKKTDANHVSLPESFMVDAKSAHLIQFEKDFATLSDLSVQKLNGVAVHLKQNPNAKVLLMSLSVNNNSPLTKNRLNSIRTFLKIKGINFERVVFESLVGSYDVDEIKISYIE